MTEQEKINQQLQRQIDVQNTRIDSVLTKVDMLVSEMRDRDNQRAAEIMEIRQDMKTMQASLDAKIEGIGFHVRNLSVATIIVVGTIAITVIYSILTR